MKKMRKVLALCLGIMMLFSSLEGLPEAVAEVIEISSTELDGNASGSSTGGNMAAQQPNGDIPAGGGTPEGDGLVPTQPQQSGSVQNNASTNNNTQQGAGQQPEGSETVTPGTGAQGEATTGEGESTTEGGATEGGTTEGGTVEGENTEGGTTEGAPTESVTAGEGEQTEVGNTPAEQPTGTVGEISLSGAPKSAFVGEQINFLLHISGTAQEYRVEWETETPDGTTVDSVTTGAVDVLRAYIPHSYGTHTVRITVSAPDGSFKQAMAVIPVADHSSESQDEMVSAFRDYELTGNWNADILAIASSQIGYAESNRNFYIDNFDVTHGYTRYGAFYGGAEYEPWDALFVNFVARMAGIPEDYLPKKATSTTLQKALADRSAAIRPDYIPEGAEPGDLVFIQDTNAMKVGVIASIGDDKLSVILGDCDDSVQVVEYELGSELVLGFGDISALYDQAVAEHAPTTDPVQQPEATEAPEEPTQPTETKKPEQKPFEDSGVIYYCGFAANYQHTHDESCYQGGDVPLCGLFEHTHSEKCTELPLLNKDEAEESGDTTTPETNETNEPGANGNEEAPAQDYVCGLVEHSHSDECYDEAGNLICGLEEHVHTDACLTAPAEDEDEPEPEEPTYYCGMVEHTHTDDCYTWVAPANGVGIEERVLTCELPEHTHTEACLIPPVEEVTYYCGLEEHTHTEECYDAEGNLICELPEHTHTDECLVPPEEEEEAPEVEYICGFEEHTHTEECYDADGNLICELPEHTHNENCVFDAFELRDSITADAEAILAEAAACTAETPIDTFVDQYNRMNGLYDRLNAALEAGEITQAEYSYLYNMVAEYVRQLLAKFDELGFHPVTAVDVQSAEFHYADDYLAIDLTLTGTAKLTELATEFDEAAMPQMTISFAGKDSEDVETAESYIEENGAAGTAQYMQSMRFKFTVDGLALDVGACAANVTITPTEALIDALTGTNVTGAQAEEAEAPTDEVTVDPDMLDGEVQGDVMLIAEDAELSVRPTLSLSQMVQAAAGDEPAADEPQGDAPATIGLGVGGFSIPVPGTEESSADEAEETETGDGEVMEVPEETEPVEMESFSLTEKGNYVGNEVIFSAFGTGEGEPTVYASEKIGLGVKIPPMNFSTKQLGNGILNISLGTAENPVYTIQHFINYPHLRIGSAEKPNEGNHPLDIIDTRGGNLPKNKDEGDVTSSNVYLVDRVTGDQDYETLATETRATRLFVDEQAEFKDEYGFNEMNRLYHSETEKNNNYELKEIWVYYATGEADYAASVNAVQPTVADESWNTDGTYEKGQWHGFNIAKLGHGNNIEFTNVSDSQGEKELNGQTYYAIYIPNLSYVRYVFSGKSNSWTDPEVNFFDYDITNTGASSERGASGINSDENYANDGRAKYAFGNRNNATDFGEVYWGSNQLNRGNSNGFSLGTYGMVKGMDATNKTPIFQDTIDAPDLFNTATQPKGADYVKGSLTFKTTGGVYEISTATVEGNTISNLDQIPWVHSNPIYSNSFWPVDKWPHDDGLFGGTDATTTWGPGSDDGKAHNSYFGMSFGLSFELEPGYCGPLEYFFYGDDDMWVFLTDEGGTNARLICDIGGVHSSIGEYVNLWDYLDQVPITDRQGKTYELHFFYTERGASGSSCYMRFCVPVKDYVTDNSKRGSVRVEKKVNAYDLEGKISDKPYTFTVSLTDGNNHNSPMDAYTARFKYNNSETTVTSRVRSGTEFTLKAGEWMEILYIPFGSTVTVTETANDTEFTTTYQIDEDTPQAGYQANVTVSPNDSSHVVTFINDYTPIPTTYAPKVTKSTTGEYTASEDTIFTFNIAPQSNNAKDTSSVTMPSPATATVEVKAGQTLTNKEVTFKDITFLKPGVYEFLITESAANHAGYVKNNVVYTLKVDVQRENGTNRKLVVKSYTYSDGTSITNGPAAYVNEFSPAKYTPEVTKQFETDWADFLKSLKEGNLLDELRFVLTIKNPTDAVVKTDGTKFESQTKDIPYTDELLQSMANADDLIKATFDELVFRAVGEYTFTITEPNRAEDNPGFTYDNAVWTMTVKVIADPTTNGLVIDTVEYKADGKTAVNPVQPGHGAVAGGPIGDGVAMFTNKFTTEQDKNETNVGIMDPNDKVPKDNRHWEVDGRYDNGGLTVMPGDTITYTIHWKNFHNTDAEIIVTDVLDKGVTYQSATPEDKVSIANQNEEDGSGGTVTWNLGTQEKGAFGDVTLTVLVNKNATIADEDYTTDSDADFDGTYEVLNQASVQVGNDSVVTDVVDNDVPNPHKEELTPGNGKVVTLGEKITYQITWQNYQDAPAKVVVTDELDPGVKYVSQTAAPAGTFTQSTNEKGHTVLTWTFTEVQPKAGGTIEFTVEVDKDNRDVVAKDWHYENGQLVEGDNRDYKVVNQAHVQVGDDPEILTEIPENPVFFPEKEEKTPGAEKPVQIGDTIEYDITWQNYHDDTADVTVVDRLDPGVDFVSASFNGVTTSNGYIEEEDSTGKLVTINYNRANHTVTWVLHDRASMASSDDLDQGKVHLVVQVNEKAKDNNVYVQNENYREWKFEAGEGAYTDFKVLNQAAVFVGDDAAFFTEIIPNPVSEPKKEETQINGEPEIKAAGKQVKVGDVLTYKITYQNYLMDGKKTVIVTDKLHDGVEYVANSAEPDITSYDETSRTLKWEIPDVEECTEGTVTFKVKVTEKALEKADYYTHEQEENVVYNKAHVAVEGHPGYDTEEIPNPVPEKKETDIHRVPTEDNPTKEGWEDKHGDTNKEPVLVGDEITYEIEYTAIKNGGKEGDVVSVVVTDVLDPGVTFVSASYHGLVLSATDGADANTTDSNQNKIELTTTEEGFQKVTWTLTEKYGHHDSVKLVVKVNENAEKAYSYKDGKPGEGTGKDFKVYDQAGVDIENDGVIYTDIPENPVEEPHKTEMDPGDKEVVIVGQNITYDIEWHNSEEETETATVTITDPLDKNVEFVSAGYVEGSPKGDEPEYDEATHTVTWTIPAAKGATGHVTLTVKVLASALDQEHPWVYNQANVTVGNHPTVKTEKPENPVGEPHKTETTPGYGEEVKEGNEINYEISWRNYHAQPAKVVVRDQLDPGVDFVSASFGGVTLNAKEDKTSVSATGSDAEGTITIAYDATERLVIWTLETRKADTNGKVKLTVKVNDQAQKNWKFDDALSPVDDNDKEAWRNMSPDPDVGNADAHDGIIYNRAGVKVGDDDEVLTEIIPNTVPEKTEEEIKHADGTDDKAPHMDPSKPVEENGEKFKSETGPNVYVGDVITYHISFGAHEQTNEKDAKVNVAITDKLDDAVDFVSASYGDVTLEGEGSKADGGIAIQYDKATHTVTWELTVPNDTDGYVVLKVRVNEKAIKEDEHKETGSKHVIENQAQVDAKVGGVGNEGGVKTNIIKNPTPEFEKTEETPGKNKPVAPKGKEDLVEGAKYDPTKITYNIHWKNHLTQAVDVVITDRLDPGVSWADDGAGFKDPKPVGAHVDYNVESHTVTWTIPKAAAGAEGDVWLTVTVNDEAYEGWEYDPETHELTPTGANDDYVYNQASVKVDNEPEVFSEIIPNPVPEPEKTVEPSEATGLKVGDTLDYKVTWWNYAKDTTSGEYIGQTVTVTDKLDPGLGFVGGIEIVGENGRKIDLIEDAEHVVWQNQTLTVTFNANANERGYVKFTAKVNEYAVYGVNANGEPTTNVDEMVINKATVKVGKDDPGFKTNDVKNPIPNPHKEETEPGNGEPVKIPVYDEDGNLISEGSQISYEIEWANYKTAAGQALDEANGKAEAGEGTTVVITDKLDPGVDFMSASFDGVELTKDTEGLTITGNATTHNKIEVTIAVTPKDGTTPYDTVTWTLKHVPAKPDGDPSIEAQKAAGSRGIVNLTVQLNENAVEKYEYDENGVPALKSDADGRWVYNQAGVKVNNDDEVLTEIPENPVPEPPKTENLIEREEADGTNREIVLTGDVMKKGGVTVLPGDRITYRIKWWNHEKDENGFFAKATVVVTDTLDANVKFVEAGYVDGDQQGDPAVLDGNVVSWTIQEADPNGEGEVWVKVEVLDSIKDVAQIENQGDVQVGNHDKQETNIIPNPTPKDDKDATMITPPAAQNRTVAPNANGFYDDLEVFVGDTIEYTITYDNYEKDPDTGEPVAADVTITDVLDEGFDYDHAEPEAEYNAATRTVTWTLKNCAPGTGTVKLYVVVNEKATPVGVVENQASVQVGNDREYKTKIVDNPTPTQEKTETDPGNHKPVKAQGDDKADANVSDTIVYEIAWQNYQTEAAEVTITDYLDPGVDIVSASTGGVRGAWFIYDKVAHLVTWHMGVQQPGANGKVRLTVVVNEKAYDGYSYEGYDEQLTPDGGRDEIVYNRAGVQVGNDPKVLTEIVDNPVPKREKDLTHIQSKNQEYDPPKENQLVFAGDTLTYHIDWNNYAKDTTTNEPVASDVTITDTLDTKVDFKAASYGDVTLEAPAESVTEGTTTITYDPATRTVTWKFNAAASAKGEVELKVEVNNTAPGSEPIVNNAGVRVGQDAVFKTNDVESPTPFLEKTEPNPGDGKMVFVGDTIDYKITWKNHKPEDPEGEGNTVTIRDPLDNGVDFKSAAYGTALLEAPNTEASGEDEDGHAVTIRYDADKHEVTWTLLNQPGQKIDDVNLSVIVNEKATPVGVVKNKAYMAIDHDPESETDEVENPTPTPDKKETYIDRGDASMADDPNPKMEDRTPEGADHKTEYGPLVFVGDQITYEIEWNNFADGEVAQPGNEDGSSDVIIRDTLDKGLNLVSASFGDVVLRIGAGATTARGSDEYGEITIAYSGRTVTWTLKNRPADTNGTVTLVTEVNEQATPAGKVENRASVQVGNHPAVDTDEVDNPTPSPKKTETTPGDGRQVDEGALITYNITWRNYKDEAANVYVTDPLDPDVEFVSASYGELQGKEICRTTDERGRTVVHWELENVPAGAEDTVELVVRVRADAIENNYGNDYEVRNAAYVQVSNDPAVKTDEPTNPLPNPNPTPTTPGGNTPVPGPEPETTTVTGTKFWIDNNDALGLRPDTIEVTLYANGARTNYTPTWNRTGNTWTYTFSNLPLEDDDGNTITYTVRETSTNSDYYRLQDATQNGFNLTNRLTEPEMRYTSVNGTKTWNDNNDAAGLRPDSITVRLYRNGEEIDSVTVTAETNWRYSFTGLPVNDGYDGPNYTYTVSEDPVENYYTVQNGTNFVNGLIPGREPGEPGPGDFTIINDAGVPLFGLPTEEQLEDLVQLFDYDTPLWGDLMKTGDELPIYPFVFAGVGVAIVAFLLLGDRKRRKAKG